MKNKNKKKRIIYILGIGHSGSTLINIIVGSTKSTFSSGELKFLKEFIENKKDNMHSYLTRFNFSCDCNNKLKNCPFWSEIVSNIDSSKLLSRSAKFLTKLKHFLYSLFNKKIEQSEEKKLYENILKQAKKIKGKEVECIIDSSKDLARLSSLTMLKGIDLKVIYLVRDGRGVVNSHVKQKNNWLISYINWLLGNLFMKIFTSLKIKNEDYFRLSYDKFTQNPEKYTEKLNKKFNLNIDKKNFINDVNKEKYHNFAGNWMRRKKLKKIKYDQSWKRQLPKWQQKVLTVLCYIPNKLWVYNE